MISRRTFVAACAAASAGAQANLPEVVTRIRPSVLPVGTFSALDNPRFSFRGSGFVVGDGTMLVTSAHVLPPAGQPSERQLAVMVLRADGGRDPRVASLIRQDRARDLALLKFEGAPLPALAVKADAAAVREGMEVALAGYPLGGVLGFSMVTHRGILASITNAALPSPTSQSLTDQAISRLRGGPFQVYQLDATAYPGNSGGPLFDTEDGSVLGVINMVLVRNTRESALSNPTGITYAIPAAYVSELLKPG